MDDLEDAGEEELECVSREAGAQRAVHLDWSCLSMISHATQASHPNSDPVMQGGGAAGGSAGF